MISVSFLPNGFQVATGSDDNTVKIWDLRKKGVVHTILAHNKLVSDIKFEAGGRLMVTSGYDQKVKVWSACHQTQSSVLLRTLTGHENKVTSACFTSDLKYMLTTSFDRTFKLWSMQEPSTFD